MPENFGENPKTPWFINVDHHFSASNNGTDVFFGQAPLRIDNGSGPSAPAAPPLPGGNWCHPPTWIKMAIEIVDLPIQNGESFHSYVAVFQRVSR